MFGMSIKNVAEITTPPNVRRHNMDDEAVRLTDDEAVRKTLVFLRQRRVGAFMVFNMMMGGDTTMHTDFVRSLKVHIDGMGWTVDEVIAAFKTRFYGSAKEGKLGVGRVRSMCFSTSLKKSGQNRKNDVLSAYKIEEEAYLGCVGQTTNFPSLFQLILNTGARYTMSSITNQPQIKRNHASTIPRRVHEISSIPEEAIVRCRDLLCSPNPPLQIMEVPTYLQGTMKWYIDWDMPLDKLTCFTGTTEERIAAARALALQTPLQIQKLFVSYGFLTPQDEIQVVIKEVRNFLQSVKSLVGKITTLTR
jgi:hypothetical protein